MTTTVKTPLTLNKPSNILVMYKGGGYDGCMFEYNYALIDDHGDFEDIFSSGYCGCDTHEKLLEAFNAKPEEFELFSLKDQDDLNKFAEEAPISHLLGVSRWLDDYGYVCSFPVTCDGCDNEVDATYCAGESPAACGGIRLQFTEMVCVDCRSIGTCCHCGEYVGSEAMVDPEVSDSGRCKLCETDHSSGSESEA